MREDQKEAIRIQLEQEQADLLHVIESPQGERVMIRILNTFGGLQTKTQIGNALIAAAQEGRRQAGIDIFNEILSLQVQQRWSASNFLTKLFSNK